MPLVVSSETITLDSRFKWVSSLEDKDAIQNNSVIIYHDSKDDENTVLSCLASLYKSDPQRKFLYINSELSPIISMFFQGINGAVFDQDVPLSDPELLEILINEYNTSDMRVKPAEDEFSELSLAMKRLLTGSLSEDEVYDIITNPDWLAQVGASMDAVSTALTVASKSSTELVTYVTRARDTYQAMSSEFKQVKEDLASALSELAKSSVAGQSNKNVINNYGTNRVPQSVKAVLYIKELSHCMFLTSFFIAYTQWLKTQGYGKPKLLVIEPRTAKLAEHYGTSSGFYLLTQDSIAHPTDKTFFVTCDPLKNVIDYFLGDTVECPLYIVIDKFYGASDILSGAPNKMKYLYASGRSTPVIESEVSPSKVIRCLAGAPENYVLPFMRGYNNCTNVTQKIQAYNTACKPLFERLSKYVFGDK